MSAALALVEEPKLYPRRIRLDRNSVGHASIGWGVWFDSFKSWVNQPHVKKADLAKYLGVKRQRLNHWLNGKTMPGWAVVAVMNYKNPLCPTLFSINSNIALERGRV